MNSITTRFAPSPTGDLHIGSIRTALINYIVTEKNKINYPDSKFLLRIEDTDKKRSDDKYINSILTGLEWMGIKYDKDVCIQSENIKRHQEIALELLKKNKAFKCICSPETLQKRRDDNKLNKINNKKLCKNCEKDPKIQSLKEDFVVRIKIPEGGITNINDLIQGDIKVNNKEIDNFILLRRDNSPTYMLSVVVDDYDMGVNFIIRGDDHLNNMFRQFFIYSNMNWQLPNYAHMPLLHGEDGKKLSKRHGDVDINELKKIGYLKDSIINNLILLGWSTSNNNEIININEIINKFEISKLSKSSSIFSYKKLNYFNNYYLKKNENFNYLTKFIRNNKKLNKYLNYDKEKLLRIFEIYKNKIYVYAELEKIVNLYFDDFDIKKNELIFTISFNNLLVDFVDLLNNTKLWKVSELEEIIKEFLTLKNMNFAEFGKPMRILLINSMKGPSISDILFILQKKDSIKRIEQYIRSN